MITTDTHAPLGEIRPPSRRVWLVRHGLTEWNTQQRFGGHSDIPLSREGRLQARWLARSLRARKIVALYSSDLSRARETAQIIAQAFTPALAVQVSSAWRELDFGAWDGLTYAEIASAFPEQLAFFTDPEKASPPGGESLVQLQQRVLAALAQASTVEPGDLLIVSHGGPLRVLVSSVLGMSLARQWQLALAPGSLSALDLLPVQDVSAPQGTLALLNVQRFSSAPRSVRENHL
jgi:alpha-ribazole phosphatase